MVAERVTHLVAPDVRRLRRLLHVHAELDDIQEKLQQHLILNIASLYREGQKRRAILKCKTWCQSRARPLAGFHHVIRIVLGIKHETLHALTHANARPAGDGSRNPTARRRHRYDPAFGIRRLNGGRPSKELGIVFCRIRARDLPGWHHPGCGVRRVRPTLEIVEIRIAAFLITVWITGFDKRIVALGIQRLDSVSGVAFRQEPFNGLFRRKIGVTVIEIPVRKGHIHDLIDGVDIAGAVVAHALEIQLLKQIERLQQHRSLHPGGQFVDLDSFVVSVHGFFDMHLPVSEVGFGVKPAEFS